MTNLLGMQEIIQVDEKMKAKSENEKPLTSNSILSLDRALLLDELFYRKNSFRSSLSIIFFFFFDIYIILTTGSIEPTSSNNNHIVVKKCVSFFTIFNKNLPSLTGYFILIHLNTHKCINCVRNSYRIVE